MKQIKVVTSFRGFHCWPDAVPEVEFLKHKHRHVFNIEARIQVTENDRELEYFMVQNFIDAIINEAVLGTDQSASSCETMAEIVLDYLEAKYPSRKISVEINEDGENGSIIDNHDNF